MIPHLGQITVQAIVMKQMPNGQFSPEAVWNDSFSINLVSESADESIKEIKRLIEVLKENANRLKPTA